MSAIADMLSAARRTFERVQPTALADEVAAGALVVDIRPDSDRAREGVMPGATVLDRNVLEWRLDPTSPDAIEQTSSTRRIIVFCNEGYASTLAVVTLRLLGLAGATDLAGGYRAWQQVASAGAESTKTADPPISAGLPDRGAPDA
jgi:rhodanese-related sulfurtransferase